MKRFALGAAAAAATATLFGPPEPMPRETRPHVLTCTPVKKPVSRRLRLPGDVRPWREVILYARVAGYLESVAVDRGAKVHRGQILATISVPELEKELARREAEVELCGPMIARDEAQRAARKAVWDRLAEVADRTPNLVGGREADEARGRFAVAQAQLEVTREREKVRRAAAERLRTQVAFATIRAPFDGYVTERWVDPGALVRAGSTPMLRLTQVDPVRVRVRVPESEALRVRADTRVRVEFPDSGRAPFEGRVARSSWELRAKTRTLDVEIDVPNPDGVLRPGMSARVALELEERTEALVLPAPALVIERRRVAPGDPGPARRDVAAEVVANQEVLVLPQVQGYVEAVFVDLGDRVRKGDALVQIAVPDLEREQDEQEAELALHPLLVALDQAELSWREAVWSRLSRTVAEAPGIVSPDLLDEARHAYEAARASLEATRARGAPLRAALQKTRAKIALATLRAPFDAIVAAREIHPGDLAQPETTRLLRLVQPDPVRVRFRLPQAEALALRPGARVTIRFPFAPGVPPVTAPVSRFTWSLDPGTKTMSAEADLPNPHGALLPGMYGRASLDTEGPETPAPPRSAERAETFVLVVNDGTVKKVPIEIGHEDGVEFEVRHGLVGDEEVILVGKNLVTEGDRVRTTRRSP